MVHSTRIPSIDPLESPRLRLIPCTAELLRAEIKDRAIFSKKLGGSVPKKWPPPAMLSVHLYFLQQLEQDPTLTGWVSWYWLLKRPASMHAPLIGCGGFKGPPRQDGRIEIGYSVLPQYRDYGYATEAVTALIGWAFSHSEVTRIAAETDYANGASIRVLEKANFLCLGATDSARTLLFELPRSQYLHQAAASGRAYS